MTVTSRTATVGGGPRVSTQGLPTLYPIADRQRDWFAADFPGTFMPRVDKILLHTTEGGGWPSYSAGSVTPNLTYFPAERKWRQHLPLNRSARALVDDPDTLVRENRDNVCQVEIICTCDPSWSKRHPKLLRVEDISDDALRDLGEFLAYMARNYRVPLIAAPKWLPYPKSAGNSPVRMNGKVFDAFRGVLGHMHASGNRHGDPGRLDVPRIIWHANRALRPIGPVLTLPANLPTRKADEMARPGYSLNKTPDERYWGINGLQCTHLENGPILRAYMEWTGLELTDAKPITYDLLENFQRIT